MGNIAKILVRDFEACNFDKIVRATLELVHVRKMAFDGVEIVREGEHDVDLDGLEADREYWKKDGRSMTELYALRVGLGTPAIRVGLGEEAGPTRFALAESGVRGLPALCQAIAANHGKVPGTKGGGLYKRGSIPSFSKVLTLLPERASEIVARIAKAVAEALETENPVRFLNEAAALSDGYWDDLDAAVAAASRAVYERARALVRSMTPSDVIHVPTRDAELPKHLWAAIKSVWPNEAVRAMVVSNPETGRVALLTNHQLRVDVRPAAQALKKRFPETGFDVNLDRGSVVYDPRSKTPAPDLGWLIEIASERLRPAPEAPPVRSSMGVTFGDAFRARDAKRR
jgi:hypothetical protein